MKLKQTTPMQIKDIGSTIERLHPLAPAAASGFDISFVLWASVKKDGWRKFHKLVVKIPANRNSLQLVDQKLLTDTAMQKMQDVLAVTSVEPE